MKQNHLYMNRWLTANGRNRTTESDSWYHNFANQLLPVFATSPLAEKESNTWQEEAAIAVTLYFQDAVAQSGEWTTFANAYRQHYPRILPLYEVDAEHYVTDEINVEDVALVLWMKKSAQTLFFNPNDEHLLALSRVLYEAMDAAFEEAPIAETPSCPQWLLRNDIFETPSTPLPEPGPQSKLSRDVERCLQHSNGRPLLYFGTYAELCRFLSEVLQWKAHESSLLPDLKDEGEFVIYANAKGMLIAPNVASCFNDPLNPYYNAHTAMEQGYELFVHPGYCPFDLLKYGMNKGLLSDVQLPFASGKELLHRNWDFIARYYLGEYYEGK